MKVIYFAVCIWLEGFFPSTKSRDDLWCVTEMHLVNSKAVIRLDTHKHCIGAPEEWNEHCLSSSFVLSTARDFEGLINTQSLERSWYSYPNKSNVLDDITEVLSPLIYICVRECTVSANLWRKSVPLISFQTCVFNVLESKSTRVLMPKATFLFEQQDCLKQKSYFYL